MLDLGLLLEKDNGGLFKIDDVCLIRTDEQKSSCEVLNSVKKTVYPLLTADLSDDVFMLPNQEELLDNVGDKDSSLLDKLKELQGRLVGSQVDINIEDADFKVIDTDNIDIKKISSEIKQSIIGQDVVVDKVISTVMHNQKLYDSEFDDDEVRQNRQSLLIFGKTGTGKTEIVKQVAKKFDIPYVIEDATKFTQEGYQARSASDMLLDLVRIADGNVELAERSILVIDEIDKKRASGSDQIATIAVQNSLLKLMDGGVISVESDPLTGETIDFDTSFLTIILSGAFSEMTKSSSKREIGFNSEQSVKKEKKYNVDDFIKYGMTPEFMGRITNIVKTNDLNYDDLKRILVDSNISPLNLKKKYLDCLKVKYNFDDHFLDMIVKEALAKKTGARGLKSAVSDVFDNLDFNLDFEVLAGDVKEIKFENGKVCKVRVRK